MRIKAMESLGDTRKRMLGKSKDPESDDDIDDDDDREVKVAKKKEKVPKIGNE
jgi:hypothetical protein